MSSREMVAIFWDYENCQPASNSSGYEVVNNLRRMAYEFGDVTLFKAYLELTATSPKSLALRSALQSSGVSLTDCPHNGRKDVADKMILVDMLAYAIDNQAPSTIILISGDRDFAYAVSVLRLRRYRVVVIAPSSIHGSLKLQASALFDWNCDILGKIDADPTTSKEPASSVNESHTLFVSSKFDKDQTTSSTQLSDSLPPLTMLNSSNRVQGTEHVAQNARFPVANESTAFQYACADTLNQRVDHDHVDVPGTLSIKVDAKQTAPSPETKGRSQFQRRSSIDLNMQTGGVVGGPYAPMPSVVEGSSLGLEGGFLPFLDTRHPQLPTLPHAEKYNPTVFQRTHDLFGNIPLAVEPRGAMFAQTSPVTPRSNEHAVSSKDMTASGYRSGGNHTGVFEGGGISVSTIDPMLKSRNANVNVASLTHPVFEELETCGLDGADGAISTDRPMSLSSSSDSLFRTWASVRSCPGTIETPPSPSFSDMDHYGNETVDGTTTTFSHPTPHSTPASLRSTVRMLDSVLPTGNANSPPAEIAVVNGSQMTDDATVMINVTSRPLPPGFEVLVAELGRHEETGCLRPSRSIVAEKLLKQDALVYKRAGVKKFKEYVALAVKARVVVIGGSEAEAWISLDPTFITSQPLPPEFKILVQELKRQNENGCPCPQQSIVAEELVKQDKLVYKRAGVSGFKEYVALAVNAQIVVIGSTEEEAWISLHPLQNIPTSISIYHETSHSLVRTSDSLTSTSAVEPSLVEENSFSTSAAVFQQAPLSDLAFFHTEIDTITTIPPPSPSSSSECSFNTAATTATHSLVINRSSADNSSDLACSVTSSPQTPRKSDINISLTALDSLEPLLVPGSLSGTGDLSKADSRTTSASWATLVYGSAVYNPWNDSTATSVASQSVTIDGSIVRSPTPTPVSQTSCKRTASLTISPHGQTCTPTPASAAQCLTTPQPPPRFRLLVERLERLQSNGFPRPFCALVAQDLMQQDKLVYDKARVKDFDEYAALAKGAGIVQLGGEGSRAWISLTA